MKPYLQIVLSMLIFGSIGIFVKAAALPSAVIALCRGATGAVILFAAALLLRRYPSRTAIRKNAVLLLFSGAAIGANWICLFEAYRYTLVSVATVCYYCAPVFVTLFSPLLLRERLTVRKTVCVFLSLAGLVLTAGIFTGNSGANMAGCLFGLTAAALYASVIFCNKFLSDIAPLDATLIQLAAAAVVILPYTLLTTDFSSLHFTLQSGTLLLAVGAVHTGLAYLLYFSAIPRLKAQSIALLSFIDPAAALLLSAVFLRERMSLPQIIGAALILCSAMFGSVERKKKSVS